MIDLALLKRLEITCYADFADVERRPYGLLYHCADNPLSHDSNHGVILDLDADLEAAVADVTAFYEGRGLEPRLYASFTAGEAARLVAMAISLICGPIRCICRSSRHGRRP